MTILDMIIQYVLIVGCAGLVARGLSGSNGVATFTAACASGLVIIGWLT